MRFCETETETDGLRGTRGFPPRLRTSGIKPPLLCDFFPKDFSRVHVPFFLSRGKSRSNGQRAEAAGRKTVKTQLSRTKMPVGIHQQCYLGEGPATRYYRGLEHRADFIMVAEGERESTIEWNVEWSVGRLAGWSDGCLLAWLAGFC